MKTFVIMPVWEGPVSTHPLTSPDA